jgi:aspartate-semialdehyde dehydrogenase
MGRIPCAVLGASGMVGSRFVAALHDHPWFSMDMLCGSDRSVGKTLRDASAAARDMELPSEVLDMALSPPEPAAMEREGVRAVFSSIPADFAGPLETRIAQAGMAVFSNARSHRMDPNVPILIPEVNPSHLGLLGRADEVSGSGFIVCNSNCTTSGLTVPLAPLQKWGIEEVVVASYQALSGTGYPGPAAISILGNVLPFIKNEEEKLRAETKKIMGPLQGRELVAAPFDVFATCVRVNTAHGHLLAVQLKLKEEPEAEEVLRALRKFTGVPQQLGLPTAPQWPVAVRTEPDRPQPKFDANAGGGRAAGMTVSVGRIRVEGNRLRFIALVHNLVRGAAGGAVLNAELAHAYQYV